MRHLDLDVGCAGVVCVWLEERDRLHAPGGGGARKGDKGRSEGSESQHSDRPTRQAEPSSH